MDPASEELERRSRYLSSLIRRTKLSAAPAPPPQPEPEPEPEVAPPPNPNPEPEPEPEAAVGKRGEAKAAEPVVEEKEKREAKEAGDEKGKEIKGKDDDSRKVSVRVRAADMPLPLQRRAVRLAYEAIAAMPRLDSKRLALALKKVCHLPPYISVVNFSWEGMSAWFCGAMSSYLLWAWSREMRVCSDAFGFRFDLGWCY